MDSNSELQSFINSIKMYIASILGRDKTMFIFSITEMIKSIKKIYISILLKVCILIDKDITSQEISEIYVDSIFIRKR